MYSLNSVKGDYRVFGAFVCPDVSGLAEADALGVLNKHALELSKIFPDKIVEVMQHKPRKTLSQWQDGLAVKFWLTGGGL